MKRLFDSIFRRRGFLGLWFLASLVASAATMPLALLNPSRADERPPAAKTFRLNDGTEWPIEEWPETTETLEWQPPIDPKKATTIVEYAPMGPQIYSISFDAVNHKIYWLASSRIYRANTDGTNRELIIDGIDTPEGKKHVEGRWYICVAPKLGRIFWTSPSPLRGDSGYSVYEATLDGKNTKPIVSGLRGMCCVATDEAGKKIYYNDDSTIQRANLDGSSPEDLGAQTKMGRSFAIDLPGQLVYSRDTLGVVRERLDGTDRQRLYESTTPTSPPHSPMVIDDTTGFLYWEVNQRIVRAPLNNLKDVETIVSYAPYSSCPFAIDVSRQKVYWAARNLEQLLWADLPQPRRTIRRPAPPLISGFDPMSAERGDEITVKGRGFSTCNRMFWIGSPTGENVEGKFRVVDDHSIVATVPMLGKECFEAAIAVLADGGVTVTLARDVAVIRKPTEFVRKAPDTQLAYLVADGGRLLNAERRLLFVERGGSASSGLRGGNVIFVKDGGRAGAGKIAGIVFFEPRTTAGIASDPIIRIPVQGIRPSYVQKLLGLNPED